MADVYRSGVPQAALPRLRITEEISRRDSITSNKTGDSGYNSDPEVSPRDFIRPDTRLLHPDYSAVPPIVQSALFDSSPIDIGDTVSSVWVRRVFNKNQPIAGILKKPIATAQKPEVTSNPTSSSSFPVTNKPDWTNVFKRSRDSQNIEASVNDRLADKVEKNRQAEVELWIDESIPSHNRPNERVSSIVSLTSNGSGGDYSATDESEGDEMADADEPMLPKATLTTIDLIMRKVEVNLNYAAYIQCAGGQTSRSQNSREASRGRRGSAQGTGGKRRSKGDESLPPDDQDDDGPNKRRRVSVTTTEESETGPRFACPFYKHDPERYRSRRTCPGPGWPTVHRMKEHLYRSHAKPIHCPRCFSRFDTDIDLSNHLRSEPCQMSDVQSIDGIDKATSDILHKRSAPLRLEEDKWRDVYQLIFPDVPPEDIPSPYYDSDSPSEDSRRFRRELLHRIRRELFATAEQASGAVEQNLLREVAFIIRRCENDILDSFRPAASSSQQPPPPPPPPPLQPERRSTASTAPHLSLPNQASPQPPFVPPARTLAPTSTPHSNTSSFGSANIEHSRETSHFVSQPPRQSHHEANPYIFDPMLSISPQPWSTGDLIDWDVIFPPGMDGQLTDRGEQPAFTTPVYT